MYERVVSNFYGAALLLLLVAMIFGFDLPNAHAAECRDGKLYEKLADGTEVQAGTCADGKDVPASQNALLRDGIFGCNASKYANIGTLSAVGGIYVPVNDAAVTINTGYLVYKECILDGVVSKISEAARTELAGTIIRQINTGRAGQALFVKNIAKELDARADRVALTAVDNANIGVMCPAFRDDVRRIQIRRYLSARNSPNSSFACSVPVSATDHITAIRAGIYAPDVLDALITPGNDPYTADMIFNEYMNASIAEDAYNQYAQWGWGNGFYPVTTETDNPFDEETMTPGHLVAQGAAQVITGGFRCLEEADEPSKICGPMFNALAQAALDRGLTGLTQAQNGLPSYVSRMVSEASAAVRQEAVNAALNILLTSRQIEAAYKRAKEGIAEVLTGAINRLRSAERACWELIIPKVEEYASTQGAQIQVATTTEFSQAVINDQILPIAELVAADLQKAERALQQIDSLIASVSNSASATNQRAALERLDTMVANGQLHTSSDATNANKQLEDVTASANTLVEETLRAWGDSTDPNVGWCNVNNPAVIEKWFNKWKK
ncbi:MAG: hypothetical protein G01um10148_97 [Parcubacteria group bacterium Gr01-1014_8]|nr:MAG: hypothetical protein G01um10148_97 [Parcubacteria group bacterium Gr01-1014_8]